MLRNWHFDILNLDHWQIAWDLWSNSWVISEPKEWAFVLIIISFIPLWFTGWIALSLVSWGKFIWFIITLPVKMFKNLFYKPVKIITTNTGVTPIKRKRSYKEIRPRALRSTPSYTNQVTTAPQSAIVVPAVSPVIQSSPSTAVATAPATVSQPAKFDHALFKFDDDVDDLDFDIDAFDVTPAPKPQKTQTSRPKYEEDNEAPRPQRKNERRDRKEPERDSRSSSRNTSSDEQQRQLSAPNNESRRSTPPKVKDDFIGREKSSPHAPTGSCADIIRQKGYEIITRITVKNTVIDYVGVSANRICLCMLDREPGDWLADEERFNDEEPLWFSENSHRISPVRKIDLAREEITNRLEAAGMNFAVTPFVIIQIGNIINAEDMFEIWESQHINVTRIDRGTPKEIRLFARALPEADKPIAPGKLDKLLNILRNMG